MSDGFESQARTPTGHEHVGCRIGHVMARYPSPKGAAGNHGASAPLWVTSTAESVHPGEERVRRTGTAAAAAGGRALCGGDALVSEELLL